MTKSPDEMNILEHIGELRTRLIYSLLIAVGSSFIAYAFSNDLVKLLLIPYQIAFPGKVLIGTGPAEALMLRINVSIIGGLIIGAPLIFFQVWMFILPGLNPNEKKWALPFVLTTSSLFFAGISFCYYIIIPYTYTFFAGEYASLNLEPTIRIGEHISFVIRSVIIFGVVFELPVLTFLLTKLGVLSSKILIDGMRYALVLIIIAAAVLTPPDVVSQLLLAGPLVIIYMVCIGTAWLVE